MSDDAKPTLKQRIKSYFDLSTAALASVIVGFVLLLLAGIAWLVYSLDPTRIAWGDYMTLPRILVSIGLWMLSCLATYFSVRVWMNDVPIGDRRIRDGWKAGMVLLSKHGVGLNDLPCFVVLGCTTRHQQDLLMGSDGFSAPHQSSADSPAIDWHLNDDRILIFCRDIGVYGSLLRKIEAQDHESRDSETTGPIAETKRDLVTSDASSEEPTDTQIASEVQPTEAIESDADTEDDDGASVPTTPESPATLTAAPPKAVGVKPAMDVESRTSTVTSALSSLDRANALVRDAQAIELQSLVQQPLSEASPSSVSSVEETLSQTLLSQLCGRVRAARFPHSSINGSLVLIDSARLTGCGDSAHVIGRAIRSDLDQLQNELGVTSPVTLMVTDKHHNHDFAELSRRLRINGQQQDVPLGKEFESAEIPTIAAMNQLAVDTVKQIQSRIHQIFQTPRSLAQPQNHRLVRVLIRCRRWCTALQGLAVESCADTSTVANPNNDPPIVSGLFVASMDETSPKGSSLTQGFIRGVFARMVDQQNHLAWTRVEQERVLRQKKLVNLLMIASIVLSIALAIQLWIALSA